MNMFEHLLDAVAYILVVLDLFAIIDILYTKSGMKGIKGVCLIIRRHSVNESGSP